MLNVKHGSCEYQLLKSFGLTRPENRTLIHRLQGERSNRSMVFILWYFELWYLDTFLKNEVILFSQKRFCALALGLELGLG